MGVQQFFCCSYNSKLVNNIFISFSLVIDEEKADSRAEVKSFDKSKLKHVETEEKNPTPTPQTLREELLPDELPDKAAELKEIERFDSAKNLKHVETTDKTHLPTKEGMIEQGGQNLIFTKKPQTTRYHVPHSEFFLSLHRNFP